MKSTGAYAYWTLLACLLGAPFCRAQAVKDCTILTTDAPNGLGATITNAAGIFGYEGTPIVIDGNGLALSASESVTITCQAGQGAPSTSGSINPLTFTVTGQDSVPIGCYPGSPSPPPSSGCPSTTSNSFGIYCQGLFTIQENQPAVFSSGNSNSYTIIANHETTVSGSLASPPSCMTRVATITSTCSPTSCPLESIAVTSSHPTVNIGSTSQYQAIGTYSDGSTENLTLPKGRMTGSDGVATTWASGDTTIATVDSSRGVATGVGAGQTIITAANGNVSGSAGITVNPPPGGGGGTGCDNTNPDEPDPNCQTHGPSPIVLDLSGRGFFLTGAKDGVLFDITGTGHPIQISWTAPGADNGFLCLPDGDGKCDDGKDLFGNFTPQPPSDHPNGFAALAVYDLPQNGGNGDGVIDSRDAIFAGLRIWVDENHDGICQPNELHTLPSLGVNSISLDYHLSPRVDQFGNRFRYRSRMNPDYPDQSQVGRIAYDVFFVTK